MFCKQRFRLASKMKTCVIILICTRDDRTLSRRWLLESTPSHAQGSRSFGLSAFNEQGKANKWQGQRQG